MNNIVSINKNVPMALQNIDMSMADDLSAGIKTSYGVISIRGASWKLKYGGDEAALLNEDGDPRPGFEVVLVKAAPNICKVFYDGAWAEGSDAAPDCSSNNGITPDAEVENPQCATCAACPQNVWGSRITESGAKGKACSDSRRVAVAPADDIANEVMDGVMLLRVPAASLKDLSIFGKAVAQKGMPYCAIVTRLSFDPDAAFPKLRYKAVRALNDDEAQAVADHLQNVDMINNVLGLAVAAPVAPTPKPVEEVNDSVDVEFEVEEVPATAKEAPKKKAAPKKKVAPKKKATEAAGSGETAPAGDLDDILADLDL